MKTSILNARTVAIVKPLITEKRTGANGEFEVKSILVRIAVDRDYKTTRTENGKTISEYATDFWLAKLTGNVAQAFADNCTDTREDGKLISRHLLLDGSYESYQSVKKQKVHVTPQIELNGMIYNLSFDTEADVQTTNTIFIVNQFKFLDKKPEKITPNTGTTVASVGSVTPVIQVTAGQPVQQPQPMQPAQSYQPIPTNVGAAQQQSQPIMSAPVQMPQAPMGAVPVVGQDFAGKEAPF